jgi:hypothetical protein
MELPLEHADLVAQHHQLDVLVHTGTGSPRSEPRSEVLELPRTKRRRSHTECLQRDRGFGALQLCWLNGDGRRARRRSAASVASSSVRVLAACSLGGAGHSSVAFTYDRYRHLFPEVDEWAATKLDAIRMGGLARATEG